jgi:hypothetical protein
VDKVFGLPNERSVGIRKELVSVHVLPFTVLLT